MIRVTLDDMRKPNQTPCLLSTQMLVLLLEELAHFSNYKNFNQERGRTMIHIDEVIADAESAQALMHEQDKGINHLDLIAQIEAANREADAILKARRVSGYRLEVAMTKQISKEQLDALVMFAAEYGVRWKSSLRHAWETGDYEGFEHSGWLQTVRNEFGPSWLVRFNLKDALRDGRQELHLSHRESRGRA
jgi:hypothetical protein